MAMAARSPHWSRVATLLGKERALFFANGVAAQMTVLRLHAERAGTRNVAIHPQSHVDVDEANGVEHAGGLRLVRLADTRPLTLPIATDR
jgi:threonine aldolase